MSEKEDFFMYVQSRDRIGYLMPDGSIKHWHMGARRFESLAAVDAEIERLGWLKSTNAWEGGPTHAYACWAFS